MNTTLEAGVWSTVKLAQKLDREGHHIQADILTHCLRLATMEDMGTLPGAHTMMENAQDIPMFEGQVTPLPFHGGHSDKGLNSPIRMPDIAPGTPLNRIMEIYARWFHSNMNNFNQRDQFGAQQAAGAFDSLARNSNDPRFKQMADTIRARAGGANFAATPNSGTPPGPVAYPNFSPQGGVTYQAPINTAPASSRRN